MQAEEPLEQSRPQNKGMRAITELFSRPLPPPLLLMPPSLLSVLSALPIQSSVQGQPDVILHCNLAQLSQWMCTDLLSRRQQLSLSQPDLTHSHLLIKMMQIILINRVLRSTSAQAPLLRKELLALLDSKVYDAGKISRKIQGGSEDFYGCELASESKKNAANNVMKRRNEILEKLGKAFDQKGWEDVKLAEIDVEYIFRSLLRNICRKVQPQLSDSPHLLQIYLKTFYLMTALEDDLYKPFREMMVDPILEDRNTTYLYLLQLPNGLANLQNYLEQAPHSALKIDIEFLRAKLSQVRRP